MTRPAECFWKLVTLVVISALPYAANAAEQPNIVYILVDNWGWGDVSVQGSSVPTPRIDSLARQGIRFTNFNVQNQCTPTRTTIRSKGLSDSSHLDRQEGPEVRES